MLLTQAMSPWLLMTAVLSSTAYAHAHTCVRVWTTAHGTLGVLCILEQRASHFDPSSKQG